MHMRETANFDSTITAIRETFSSVIGAKVTCYETAELLHDDGSWTSWPDLPIRLHTDDQKFVAIAWSEFDELWLATDESQPFPIEGSTVRWVKNTIDNINGVVGNTILSVEIGRGQMSVEGRDVEIWT